MIKNKIADKLLTAVIFILVWQVFYSVGVDICGWWKPYAVPSPAGVVNTAIHLISSGSLASSVLASIARGFWGFMIALAAGSVLGILMVNYSYFRRNLKPVISGVQSLPSICWVPFAILWFGLGDSAILFVVVMGSVFSIALAIDSAVCNVEPIYIKAALTMGATKKDLYQKVIFPAAVPTLTAGLKQSWSFAWRALMSGEVMSSSMGLGYTLMLGRDFGDINQVMLIMLVIIVIGMMIDRLVFNRIERKIQRKWGLSGPEMKGIL